MHTPAAITLRQYFVQHHQRYFLSDVRPGTLEQYEYALRHWERLTPDKPIEQINNTDLAQFKAALLDKGLRRATVNKTLRHIQPLLNKAGPPGPGNRDALNLIDAPPWTRTLKTETNLPRFIPGKVLCDIYRACDIAKLPTSATPTPPKSGDRQQYLFDSRAQELTNAIEAPTWWRALIVITYCLAIRRRVALSLRWSQIDLHGATCTIDARPDKANTERAKPLHDEAVRHLVTVRNGQERVFDWKHGTKAWYATWHAIQDAAGVDAGEHYHFHDLKRTAGTELGKYASAFQIQGMLDHANISTSQRYVSPIAALREAVDRLPVPWIHETEVQQCQR